MNQDVDTYLTPAQVAKQLMVSPAAVRIWVEKGELNASTTPGGHRRFLQADVDRFALERGLANKSASSKKLGVLIVDDDIQFAGYLEELLSEFPVLNVDVANDGFDAGIKVRDMEPDVVILDLMMPSIDGFEVCQRLKSSPITSHIRVIAMTGYPSAENLKKALEAGAEVCLTKPLHRKDLFELLNLDEIERVLS